MPQIDSSCVRRSSPSRALGSICAFCGRWLVHQITWLILRMEWIFGSQLARSWSPIMLWRPLIQINLDLVEVAWRAILIWAEILDRFSAWKVKSTTNLPLVHRFLIVDAWACLGSTPFPFRVASFLARTQSISSFVVFVNETIQGACLGSLLVQESNWGNVMVYAPFLLIFNPQSSINRVSCVLFYITMCKALIWQFLAGMSRLDSFILWSWLRVLIQLGSAKKSACLRIRTSPNSARSFALLVYNSTRNT